MNKMLNICKNQVILRVNYILRDKKTHCAKNLRSQAEQSLMKVKLTSNPSGFKTVENLHEII